MSMTNRSKLVLHEVTDCTSRLNHTYLLRRLRLLGPVLLGIDELEIIETSPGIFEYETSLFEEFNRQVKQVILEQPAYSYNLITRTWQFEHQVTEGARNVEAMLASQTLSWEILKDFFDDVALFCSYRIIHSYPFDELRQGLQEIIPVGAPLNTEEELYNNLQIVSCPSYFSYKHTMLIKTALKLQKGVRLAIDTFIRSAGFLDTRTIKPSPYEDPQYVKNICAELVAKHKVEGLIRILKRVSTEKRNALRRHAWALDYVALHKSRVKTLNPEMLLAIAHLASFCHTYEERKHYWHIRLLRLLRLTCQKLALDPSSTTYQELEWCLKNYRGSS